MLLTKPHLSSRDHIAPFTSTMALNKPAQLAGFTLPELIIVIVILGIVSVYAIPRLGVDSQAIRSQQAGIELAAAIRYAQSMSMNNSGAAHYQIAITPSGFTVSQKGTNIADPVTGTTPYSDDQWSGRGITSTTATTIAFNGQGEPLQGGAALSSNLSIALSSAGKVSTVVLHRVTGYVQLP